MYETEKENIMKLRFYTSETEKENIMKLMKYIHDNIEQELNCLLKSEDLTLSQGQILKFLLHQHNYQASFKEVEKALNVAQSTTAGLVSRLEKKNFIETFTDENDKRIKILRLTNSGIDVIDTFRTHMETFQDKLFVNLTDIELTLLAELLKKVNNCFE